MRTALVVSLLLSAAAALADPDPSTGPEQGAVEPDASVQETEGEDDDSSAEDDSPVIPTARPPREIRRWYLEGELIDPRPTLEAFLSPLLGDPGSGGANWSEGLEERVFEVLATKLRYHGRARTQAVADGGVSLVLTLEPITTVRYIQIDIRAGALERFREPIFADEVQRRMTLRQGSSLARSAPEREAQLRSEADRLARFLRNDGFFDATVRIEERPVGPYAAKLSVIVTPGTPYKIGKITVTGNDHVASSEIVAKFHHRRWIGTSRFTRSQLNRDVDAVAALYQTRGFPGVRVRTDFHPSHSFKRDTKTVEFTVEIRERRQIDVVFEGNSKYSSESLKEVLTLSQEGSYDDVEVEASAEAIRTYYQTRGHFEASVAWQRVRFGVFERIIFSIDRGPQLKVRRVSFAGNRAISSRRLRDVVLTSEYRRIIIGESGGYATTVQLEQDALRIQRAYAKRGYPDAKVLLKVSRSRRQGSNAASLAAAVASGKEADGLFVHFDIEEGPLLVVDRIEAEFVDRQSLTTPFVLEPTSLRVGKPFQASAAEEDARKIRQQYLKSGYPRTTVEPAWERLPSGRVRLVYKITEGLPARIGKTLIRGNYKTQDWVIRSEMGLGEGRALTLGRTDRAQANLRGSGLFSSVKIDYLGADNPRTETVNVLVNVEESRDVPLLLNFGGGYSTDSKAFSEAGATVPNMAGTGADLDLRGQLGQEIQSAQATLSLPRWIMRHATGAEFAWNLRGVWTNQLTQRFGELRSYGGSIAATKQGTQGIFEGWLFSMRYDFRQRNRDEELVRPAGNSDDVNRSPVGTRVSSIGPSLIIDKRVDQTGQRNPLAPARGWRMELRGSFAEDFTPLGSNRFVKLGASGQHFWSFGERFRLSNAIRYDHGIPMGGDVLLPAVERFFAGGDVTVRGFEEDRLATEVIVQEVPPAAGVVQYRVLPAGGNIRFIHNIELEVIAYRWTSLSMASALFLDTGLVTNSLDGFRPSDLRHSFGVALARLVTPFGSLSAEWAIPLEPQLGDNPRGRAHLNFGFLF